MNCTSSNDCRHTTTIRGGLLDAVVQASISNGGSRIVPQRGHVDGEADVFFLDMRVEAARPHSRLDLFRSAGVPDFVLAAAGFSAEAISSAPSNPVRKSAEELYREILSKRSQTIIQWMVEEWVLRMGQNFELLQMANTEGATMAAILEAKKLDEIFVLAHEALGEFEEAKAIREFMESRIAGPKWVEL
jgi:hypothetical protein